MLNLILDFDRENTLGGVVGEAFGVLAEGRVFARVQRLASEAAKRAKGSCKSNFAFSGCHRSRYSETCVCGATEDTGI